MASPFDLARNWVVCGGMALGIAGCALLPLDDIAADDPGTDAAADPEMMTPDDCVPECSSAQCGSDGCGGSCGSCDSNTEECHENMCLYQSGVYLAADCQCEIVNDPNYPKEEPLCASGSAWFDPCIDLTTGDLVYCVESQTYGLAGIWVCN